MKTYKVGIIGCGAILPSHAYSLHMLENTEVTAVCDIKPDALEKATELFQCDGYTDYMEMLKRDDLDAVHVLTPHHLHAPMTIAAANSGRHVLCEKPMSIELDHAIAMVMAAKDNDITFGIISQNRYNAPSIAAKEAIASGSMGKVLGQRIYITSAKPESYYLASDWRGTWEKEGGALLIDQAIHMLDLGRWIIGDEIASVEATMANRMHPVIKTEDTAEGLIKYKNGARTVFYATNNFVYDAPVIIETFCENGIVNLDYFQATITYIDGRENIVVGNPNEGFPEKTFVDFFHTTPMAMMFETFRKWGLKFSPIRWKGGGGGGGFGMSHFKQIKNFYDSIEANVLPDIHGEEALATHEMMWAIYKSAKEKKEIQLH